MPLDVPSGPDNLPCNPFPNVMPNHLFAACLTFLLAALVSARAEGWTFAEGTNARGPGRRVEVLLEGRPVARFIHGEGQFKPYLHLLGEAGELLTNPGMDFSGKPTGMFPHHRGIFIGWNKITSNLGSFDLWHFNNGGRMEVLRFDKLEGGKDSATLEATIAWRAGKKDESGSDLLLTETRTLKFSRPAPGSTQVDARFSLKAARALQLGGDRQHAGIHFRAANEVSLRAKETSYVSSPENKETKGRDWTPEPPKKGKDGQPVKEEEPPPKGELNWCRLLFPIGERWYAATELNAPANPSGELSWRDYGRFGFFFKRRLAAGETLDVNYRFQLDAVAKPAQGTQPSAEQTTAARAQAEARFQAFAKSFPR